MHLDEPLSYQFAIFVGSVFQGDLGSDVFSNRSVALTLEQLPHTISLALAAIGWSALLGIPLGCLSAIRPNSLADRVTGIFSEVWHDCCAVLPDSRYGRFLIFNRVGLVSSSGHAGDGDDISDRLYHLVLPAFAVGLGWVGYLARMVRATMLEVMEGTFRSARAFGLSPNQSSFDVHYEVAILPTITLIGVGFGSLLSGTVFAEIIFSRPGVGKICLRHGARPQFPRGARSRCW